MKMACSPRKAALKEDNEPKSVLARFEKITVQ